MTLQLIEPRPWRLSHPTPICPPIHESFFSYNVTRPYSHRWFTPVAVLGAVTIAALFSLLNFAANGYDLVLQISPDPNSTISSAAWLGRWPSYFTDKVRPTCQPATVPVGSQVFTNQTSLTYTLTAVWQLSGGMNSTAFSSMSYFNNVLENCMVSAIEINLEALDRTGSQFGFSEWGAVVQTYILCGFYTPSGLIQFNLTQAYDYIPAAMSWSHLYTFLGTNFLDRDKNTRASLWWGESVLSNYYVYLTRTMQDIRANATKNDEPGIRKGTIYMTPGNSSARDITSVQFFNIDYRFIVDLGYGNFEVLSPGEDPSVSKLDQGRVYPDVWIIADSLAKSAYSTVLTDLGQIAAEPNLLTNADDLEYFSRSFSTIQRHKANADSGPEVDMYYGTAKNGTGPLGTTPSVISMDYVCQVPRLKSTGNLLVSILVADLVFLQAAWRLFKLVTDTYLFKSKPESNQCKVGEAYVELDKADSVVTSSGSNLESNML
ncbi:hypothetical protein PMG11_00958 [Penicillium brasilianum]|uniref:Uncharacterized protein n=1 Tax=Penicillium brasilianum TaxID=104259 RepID=A0A0F7TI34_PENBI|nr:hypothetical protein PMG11_00958 [Penicillium brasilianum]